MRPVIFLDAFLFTWIDVQSATSTSVLSHRLCIVYHTRLLTSEPNLLAKNLLSSFVVVVGHWNFIAEVSLTPDRRCRFGEADVSWSTRSFCTEYYQRSLVCLDVRARRQTLHVFVREVSRQESFVFFVCSLERCARSFHSFYKTEALVAMLRIPETAS